jgi:sulfite exporter TauE/SafE
MDLNYSIALLLGLFSSVHCLGMCGGIIGALSMGLPESIRNSSSLSFIMVCGYNLGRIVSYACAGLLFGSVTILLPETASGHLVLQIIAAVILIVLGLNIGGWLRRWSAIETIGLQAWRCIQPLGKRFIPVNSVPRALMMGMVWGWLPCGLVYSVLLWAAVSGGPVSGALTMLCFGLGTLPSMITTGMTAGGLRNWLQRGTIKKTFAVIIILFGLASPWVHLTLHGDAGHAPVSTVHQHH